MSTLEDAPNPWRNKEMTSIIEFSTTTPSSSVKTKRMWEKPFEGAHSDIGGGYADGTNLKALEWMCSTAIEHGVTLNPQAKEFLSRKNAYKQVAEIHDSRWKNDKIPFTKVGRYSRCIFPGNLISE